jgi:response regulator NasT
VELLLMNLLVVAEQPGQGVPYIRAASRAGWRVACESNFEQLSSALAVHPVDAAVLLARHIDEVVLQAIQLLNNSRPLPVVLFTEDSGKASIRAAVMAGVSVYVVDCNNVNRIASLLDVAIIRCNESQQLKKALHKARTALAERNTVDKAKGIIMRQRRVSEDTAYSLLRKLAMDRNRRIGEVAGEVIAAAEVLI